MPLRRNVSTASRDDPGVLRAVETQRDRRVRAGRGDADDVGRRPTVEHRAVLELGGQPGGPGQVVELRIPGPALDVVDLAAQHGERDAELGQRQHLAAPRPDLVRRHPGRQVGQLGGAPEARRVAGPPPAAHPLGQPARGQQRGQPLLASSSITFQARVGIGARSRSR
jgi:hypothetical protein